MRPVFLYTLYNVDPRRPLKLALFFQVRYALFNPVLTTGHVVKKMAISCVSAPVIILASVASYRLKVSPLSCILQFLDKCRS